MEKQAQLSEAGKMRAKEPMGTGAKVGLTLCGLLVVGVVVRLVDGAPLPPSAHVKAPAASVPPVTAPALPPVPPLPVTAPVSEFANFVPTELPGFKLTDTKRHPRGIPGRMEFPQTGVWASYIASDGGASARMLVQRSSEKIGEGRRVKLGKLTAAIAPDGDIVGGTAVTWRSGDLACVLWYYPSSASDKRRMHKEAVTLATAAAAWTEKVAAGGFDPNATAANAAASAAVSSDTAPGGRGNQWLQAVTSHATANQRLQAVTSYLPNVVESASATGNELTVEVKPAWHLMPRAMRAEQARKMWLTWASANTPDDPDKSYLKITDGTGHKIGGSGWMGSSVDVDDD